MKKRNFKDKITLDPIMTLLIMIVITILISGFLALLGVKAGRSKKDCEILRDP